MATRGMVVRWLDRGFGFIQPEEGGAEIFVHISNLPTDLQGPASSGTIAGTEVTYEVEQGPKGPRAINVTGLVRLPEGDLKVFRLEDLKWSSNMAPCIFRAWNPKNPREADRDCLVALATGQYYGVFSGHNHHAVAHKSFTGLVAMVTELCADVNHKASVGVVGKKGYVFVARLHKDISPSVWAEAARHAGLEQVEVVLCAKSEAYVLSTDEYPNGFGGRHVKLVMKGVYTLIDASGSVRWQSVWQVVKLADLPKGILPAEAEKYAAEAREIQDFGNSQVKDGIMGQGLLALLTGGFQKPYSVSGVAGLRMPKAPDAETLARAKAYTEHEVWLGTQDPLKGWGVEIQKASDGTEFVVGWCSFASGRREVVPVLSESSRGGLEPCYSFRLDLSAFGHGEVLTMDPVFDKRIVSLAQAGMVARSTDLIAEVARIKAEAATKALAGRKAEAHKPFIRAIGADRTVLQIVEYDEEGNEVMLAINDFDQSDRYNYYLAGTRQDGTTVRLRVSPNDSRMVSAAQRTWEKLRPVCEECDETLSSVGPSWDPSKQWLSCFTAGCKADAKRRAAAAKK